MTESTATALRQSRELAPDQRNLPLLFTAEETIARMSDEDVMELQEQLGRTPTDGFLYLWLGLAARHRQQWTAALDAFGHAVNHGCAHWRIGWYIAQTARDAGQLQLVDQACAAVLKANPQFWFARELPKHARGYYSQIGQDKVVEQFFAKVAPRNKVFVEVGAFDGVHYSNVRRLQQKHGWSGITFEPVSKNFKKVVAAYAGTPVKCVQAAVSTADSELEINVSTYPHLPDWGSDVATLGVADTTRWEREYGATWTKEKVPVRRLTRLLNEAGIEDFDFISIDTEGHDLEVLKSIDFKRYHPLLIVIEYGENKSAIAEILAREGYGVLQDNGMDFIACPKVLPSRATVRPPRVTPTLAGKAEQFVEQFFAHQTPRSRTLLELGARTDGFRHLIENLGWTRLGGGTGTPDLLVVSETANTLATLQSADLTQLMSQVVAVAYGPQRAAILSLLGQKGYSPFADEDGVLVAARFSSLSSALAGVPATRSFTGLTGKPAYNEIEDDFQANLHGWLGRPADRIERIVIVGGCYGLEVKTFIERYPRAEVHVFEPSQRHFPRLQAAYAHEPRVRCHRFAVSDHQGTAIFHEGSLQGTGSLMPLCDKNDPDAWVPFEAQEKFEVQLTTLDTFEPLRGAAIDLLWCDVQGAELQVLRGGRQTLARCRAIFLEVATNRITYQGQCRFHELDRCAHEAGFYLAAIGLCPSGNGTGNAAWLRLPAAATGAAPVQTSVPTALRPIAGDELQAALTRLQPYLLAINYLPLNREVRTGVVDPLELVTPARFDLAIKYLYARHRELGVQSSWARELYHAHIRAFSGGSCREGDGTKQNIEDYFRAFDSLLDDVKARGFDPARSLVPVAAGHVLIDGAHRAAACLLHRQPVQVLAFDRTDERFGFAYFKQQGLDEASADAAALQYCRLRPDTFVVTVFPSAAGREDEVRALLNRHGRLVYAKQVALNRLGARNLICQFYLGESWLGDWRNGFAGANGKMEPCFRGDGPVRVYVLQAAGLDAVRAAKTAIRDLFGLANHSVHINDTHADTVRLAQLFFNANSVHFLNHAKPRHLERFVRHLERYRKWLGADGRDPENFCIDGSAVMAVYGLRDAQDLDVLHYGPADFKPVMPEINSHNADAHHHTTTRDDIIFNPANHFHAFGLKFASIDVIRRMKSKRDEGKDRKDVALIDACCGTAPAPAGLPANRPPKIIALIPARNEAARLPFCLRALKPYVDAVVYLDDCSDDDSVKVVESLAAECRVERIISKTVWHRDEPGDRNALLDAGRKLGGTHFVVIDADEAFTANCAKDNYLRRLVLSLRPGESLTLSWIQLWRSLGQYRFDQSQWTYAAKAFAFCDDGHSAYQSGFIHTQRVPKGLTGRNIPVVNYVHGLLHFQFVNWPNLQIKQAWYRCMERTRPPRRSAAEINTQYAPSEDETGLELRDAPADWLEGYVGLDAGVFAARDKRRVREVLAWFREHGVKCFADLDIWRVDWVALCDDAALAEEIRHAKSGTGVAPRISPLSTDARRHMVVAGEHLARGDLAGCRASVERAHAEAPGHPEILAALGNMHFVAKEFAEARKRFEASLALSPGQAKVWCQLAATQLRLKNPAGFLTALQKALELDPENAAALRLLADHQAQRGQHRAAAGAYRKLALLAPRDAAVRVLLGQTLLACGEHDEAAQALRQALALDPNLATARRTLDDLGRKNGNRRPAPVAEACVR
jgi:FkbM family methyltransferase